MGIEFLILISMIFFHILDDYGLQGTCLCDLKQRSFWEKNAPEKMYEKDYIWALIMHAFSWTFCINIPIIFVILYNGMIPSALFYIAFLSNVFVHAYIDDMKANKKRINLWEDQLSHIYQIGITFLMYLIGMLSVCPA
jgi:hypothetical protein